MAESTTYRVVISEEFSDDLVRIEDFYINIGFGLYDRVRTLIFQCASGIGSFPGPYRYPAVSAPGFEHYREAYVPFGKGGFVLRYDVDEARKLVTIYRVFHNREDRFE